MSFVDTHGLWTSSQSDAYLQVLERLKKGDIEVVRFSFPDQHGLLRGKTLVVDEAIKALKSGVTLTTTLFAKDTSHRTVFPVYENGGGFDMPEMQGACDTLMVADPETFRTLPWAPHTGWILCDVYFTNGNAVPFGTRHLFRRALEQLSGEGYDFVSGLEVEFHVFKITNENLGLEHSGQPGIAPDIELLSRGYQYLTELRYDAADEMLEKIRKDVLALGLPLRSLEVEYGPSQFEFTFAPTKGIQAADDMVLFRSAVKQICQRNGYHATFMCRPRIPNVVSSGWHLHQSLTGKSDGANAFVPETVDSPLSVVGQRYLAGLLAHAQGATALATPTINGYRRYRPYSNAPDRAIWGRDNRGVMLRVLGAPGDPASRIENRIGEPTANPYLYFASQVFSGLDGMRRALQLPPSADTPYETQAAALPRTLDVAIDALRTDECLREGFGGAFVDYFCKLKEAEVARFNLEVTEWEHREYFEMF
ncbi:MULTISPECIES: glutamine synthetase family protein [unclassified Caballeronia]|uniref:glutamine synthetase family protein n=1 Tax=unclassified Caballeronia TaxID=2646786 RepID=UPI00025BC71C|nr:MULTISPECIES: glutamine synthetase family protein [unclassified Caballeronia]EKS70265.1 glutamine synthetase [Burkholderia sp. SJ98]MCE4546462.1 glutamine synthetase family protein [Caballeronia sp. PC1]MCE4573064.1 glutamine synthetase family protein [Caballeronia sp. CLC5]